MPYINTTQSNVPNSNYSNTNFIAQNRARSCDFYRLPLEIPTGCLFGFSTPFSLVKDKLTRLILSFLDEATWKNLPLVNKTWYEAVRGRAFLIPILSKLRESPQISKTLNWMENLQGDLRQPAKQQELLQQALETIEKEYGPSHSNVAICLHKLGLAWKSLGELQQAIHCYERALSIDKNAYGPDHPKVAVRFNNLGLAWATFGMPSKAIDYYNRALRIVENAYGPKHPNVAFLLNNLGIAYHVSGLSKEAITAFQRAYQIVQDWGEDHPDSQKIRSLLEQAQKIEESRKMNNRWFGW